MLPGVESGELRGRPLMPHVPQSLGGNLFSFGCLPFGFAVYSHVSDYWVL